MKDLFAKRWFRVVIGLVALVAMYGMARYQRRTGPTWPVPVEEIVAGTEVSGELIRTQPGDEDARVAVTAASAETQGEVVWRRYPTHDEWNRLAMVREESEGSTELAAYLPNQPPAAKLEYSVRLWQGNEEVTLPHGGTAVIRFRGEVPAWVLIPHIIIMFLTLWIVFRAALGAPGRDRCSAIHPIHPGLPALRWFFSGSPGPEVRLRRLVDRLAFRHGLDRQQDARSAHCLACRLVDLQEVAYIPKSSRGHGHCCHDHRLPDPAQHGRQRARLGIDGDRSRTDRTERLRSEEFASQRPS